jgi:hypothetical protein
MAQIINQYSFAISIIVLLAILAVVLLRSPQRKRAWLVLLGVAVAAALSWAAIRPTASQVNSAAEVMAVIGSGKPVLVEFQSPF